MEDLWRQSAKLFNVFPELKSYGPSRKRPNISTSNIRRATRIFRHARFVAFFSFLSFFTSFFRKQCTSCQSHRGVFRCFGYHCYANICLRCKTSQRDNCYFCCERCSTHKRMCFECNFIVCLKEIETCPRCDKKVCSHCEHAC